MNESPRTTPPGWLDRLLGWFCRKEEVEVLRGDLYELYAERLQEKGRMNVSVR
ncbi:permease prefix domain 2-containing transporter [Fulvivirga sp. M361]|uniref:permease prefix domain 2-containing transporter n=1 Tax=Fulvivirga sp. M361 TaxID=2594266 RepID=UPI001629C0DB|nr:permease prefix domain 2-containing transporter [Fulvivirga sp. M361]